MFARRTGMPVVAAQFPAIPDLDRLFGPVLDGSLSRQAARSYPAINAWEDDAAVYLEAEVPGFAMTDLDITLTGRTLTIAGERTQTLREGATVHRQERPRGRFSRSVHLNTDIDAAKVVASLERGVLHVALPKAEAVKARRIEVKSKG